MTHSFWIPLIGLYTGARREEICQLHLDDIRQQDGIWVLDINDNPSSDGVVRKGLKTDNARRLIPLHDYLINDMNFIGFVESVKAEGHERLFPGLKHYKNKYGRKFGDKFNESLKKIELEVGPAGKKSFHSFRHSFAQFFKVNKLQDDDFTQVFGHSIEGLAARLYGDDFPVAMCKELIDKLDYAVDLSHLTKSKFVVKK